MPVRRLGLSPLVLVSRALRARSTQLSTSEQLTPTLRVDHLFLVTHRCGGVHEIGVQLSQYPAALYGLFGGKIS